MCGENGVYVIDRVMHPSQEYGLHGTGSNPGLLTVPQETLTGAGHEVVEMELGDFLKGTIRIRNAFALRDLSGYYLEWSILRNGEKTEEGRRQPEVAPGEQTMLSRDFTTRFNKGNEIGRGWCRDRVGQSVY